MGNTKYKVLTKNDRKDTSGVGEFDRLVGNDEIRSTRSVSSIATPMIMTMNLSFVRCCKILFPYYYPLEPPSPLPLGC